MIPQKPKLGGGKNEVTVPLPLSVSVCRQLEQAGISFLHQHCELDEKKLTETGRTAGFEFLSTVSLFWLLVFKLDIYTGLITDMILAEMKELKCESDL